MLFVGEEVGALRGKNGAVQVDIAVDPLEGTNLCATGSPDSIAVLAAAERGGLLHAPDVYMEKLVVGPTARGTIHIDAPVVSPPAPANHEQDEVSLTQMRQELMSIRGLLTV